MVCGTMRAVDSSSAASSKRRIDTSRSCVPDHGRLAFPSTALSGACDAVIACSRRGGVSRSAGRVSSTTVSPTA